MYMCVHFKIILSYFIIIYLNPYFIPKYTQHKYKSKYIK